MLRQRQKGCVIRTHTTGRRDPVRTDPLDSTFDPEGYVRKTATEELLPDAQEMTDDALNVAGFPAYIYRKRKCGRYCSCNDKHFYTPNSECLVCFGTGRVGGYDKSGFQTDVLDVSYPKQSKYNVIINPNVKPNHYELNPVKIEGVVVFEVPIPKCQYIDKLICYVSTPKNTSFEMFVAPESSNNFQPATRELINSYINGGVSKMQLQVTLKRDNTTIESPTLTHVYVRWAVSPQSFLLNLPNLTKSIAGGDFQLPDIFETIEMEITHKVGELSTEDFFEIVKTGDRLKITEITAHDPIHINLGYSGSVRPVTDFEVYKSIP